jgi:hypothetical protein
MVSVGVGRRVITPCGYERFGEKYYLCLQGFISDYYRLLLLLLLLLQLVFVLYIFFLKLITYVQVLSMLV